MTERLAVLRYHRTRQRAGQSDYLLRTLAGVTADINAADTFDGLARATAAGAVRLFAAQVDLILELPDGQARGTAASPRHPEPRQHAAPREVINQVIERAPGDGQGSAAVMVSREDWLGLVPDSPLRSEVCLAAARRSRVVLAVDHRGMPGEEESQALTQLLQVAALAAEVLRTHAREHLLAMTLRRSLLPATLPEVPGLAMSCRYIPAGGHGEVGGDLYEALRCKEKLLVAIGDVQGHSLRAATVMGELRHALRAFVAEGHGPRAITGLLNEILLRYHPGILATLCLAVLDPASGELQIVNCGHMPLLLVDGASAAYVGQGGLLLGMPMHEPHTEMVSVPAGGTVLLFTDGLVDERKVFLDVNMEKLRTAAEQAGQASADPADVEAFSNHLMSVFGPREDDVAMIALRRIPGTPA
jgi:serine phosphatase RsbU (regulator of sigma subunit)